MYGRTQEATFSPKRINFLKLKYVFLQNLEKYSNLYLISCKCKLKSSKPMASVWSYFILKKKNRVIAPHRCTIAKEIRGVGEERENAV